MEEQRKIDPINSKLLSVEVENFMTIKERAKAEFDATGIISLCGYNDSGKSAFAKAVEIILFDSYPTEQVNFITDGEEFSFTQLNFDDGISISKEKQISGQSLWKMMHYDKMIYTNQAGREIVAIKGVPSEIEAYLRVVKDETTGEKLNVRRNSDKLFLINTSGGQNYKIINTILKSEMLSTASMNVSAEKNAVNSELKSLETKRETLQEEYNAMPTIGLDMISALKNRSVVLKNATDGFTRMQDIVAQRNGLAALEPHPELQMVDTSQYVAVQGVIESRSALDIDITPELSMVNIAQYEAVQAVIESRSALDIEITPELALIDTTRVIEVQTILSYHKDTQIEVTPELAIIDLSRIATLDEALALSAQLNVNISPEMKLIDTVQLADIKDVGVQFNALYNVTQEMNDITQQITMAEQELAVLAQHYDIKVCGNCGSAVI